MLEFILGSVFRMSLVEIDGLKEILETKNKPRLLEIGSYQGHTTCYISQVCSQIRSWKEHDPRKFNTYFDEHLSINGIVNVDKFEFIDIEELTHEFDIDGIFVDYLLTEDWIPQLTNYFKKIKVWKIIRKIDDYKTLIEGLKSTHDFSENHFFILCEPKKKKPSRIKKNSTT